MLFAFRRKVKAEPLPLPGRLSPQTLNTGHGDSQITE